MTKQESLKIRELIFNEIHRTGSTPALGTVNELKMSELSAVPISHRLDYTAPYIYFGCSNRGLKKGEVPKMNIHRDWYIMYREHNPLTGEKEPILIKGGINEYHTIAERQHLAKNMLKALEKLLKDGLRHFSEPDQDSLEGIKFRSIENALRIGLKIKIKELRSKHTKGAYTSQIDLWIKTFTELRYNFPIMDLSTKHIYIAWDKMRDDREKVTGKRYGNKRHLDLHSTLCSVLQILKRLEVWKYNPAMDMELPKIPKKGKVFIPWTEKEIKAASIWAKANNYRFYLILKIILRTGIRPVEILRLKPPQIDFFQRLIRTFDYTSKNQENQEVPLDDELLGELQNAIKGVNPDWHIFSVYKTFEAGLKELAEPRLSDYWRSVRGSIPVEDKMGIDKKIYALKHTRGKMHMQAKPEVIPADMTTDQMLRKILELLTIKGDQKKLDELMVLFRHSDASISKIYAEGNEEEIKERLRKTYPEF